jgi:hypothetical protein
MQGGAFFWVKINMKKVYRSGKVLANGIEEQVVSQFEF